MLNVFNMICSFIILRIKTFELDPCVIRISSLYAGLLCAEAERQGTRRQYCVYSDRPFSLYCKATEMSRHGIEILYNR